jgi:hypothetical protein
VRFGEKPRGVFVEVGKKRDILRGDRSENAEIFRCVVVCVVQIRAPMA